VKSVFMVLLVGLVTRTVTAAVYPPHATVEGKTLEEWSAEWWKWACRLTTTRGLTKRAPMPIRNSPIRCSTWWG
jgi:hypothetical protein